MKKILFFIAFYFSFNGLIAQEYFLGGSLDDFGRAIEQTSDSGFVLTGFTYSLGAGGADYYLAKTDPNGNLLWQKTFGGTANEFSRDLLITPDSGIALIGYSESFGSGVENVYLVRTNSIGDTLWTRTYGGNNQNQGYAIDMNTDGGFIITGYTNSTGAGSDDVYLIRTDINGDTIWTKTYGGSNVDRGYAVKQTNSGGFIIAGYTNSFSFYYDIYLINTDANGDTLWTKRFGGSGNDRGYAVQQTTDGGFIVVGYTSSFGAGQSDVYIIKTDINGNLLWSKTYGGITFDYGYSVRQLPDSGYIIAGETESFGNANGKPDMYILRLDNNGDTLWTKTYGGPDWDYARSVCYTADSGFVVIGAAENLSLGLSDIYIVKLDSTGSLYSGSTTTTEQLNFSDNSGITLFPNPADDWFSFISKDLNNDGSIKVSIFNTTGQQLFDQKIINFTSGSKNMISIKNLTPGAYLVIVSQKNKLQTLKLLVK